ncbi:anhydro-N-acetylmuramic acid kinase [Sphingomonas spermidinifaciens]|uniref:anhydro-N-acetylmuramic acid kinase n=1 Tax=Sphingomonas spermidinifaciens TaxID=1141889 RepID=UPI001FE4B577|nr:anhydro-N-acetylmuramic acid kinase [Sphingomonas spermidinifaciens]
MKAIGLMSGTSIDAIDAALVETDGEGVVRSLGFVAIEWSDADRALLMAATERALAMAAPGPDPLIDEAAARIGVTHAAAVSALLRETGAADVSVIGFHGQTIAHRPDRGWTWQLGDGAALAAATGIDVVADFRSADVAAGGQGAPLLPVYHRALVAGGEGPVAVLNLGGVANVTFIDGETLIAFDTGPANGLIDSWVAETRGDRFDDGGALAATGRVDEAVLTAMLDHPYFDMPPPKSLDRNDFTVQPARGLADADGAATLTAFTAQTVAEGLRLLPARPSRLIVAGGGRRNPVLMAMIAERTGLIPEPADMLGWNGDALEAEGFAYMAVRSLMGLPLSFPGTTGAPAPLTGGTLHRAGA